MERTLCVNYPVLRQNKCVLLNTFVKNTVIRFFSVHSIFRSLLASRIDVQCCIFRPWCFWNIFNYTRLFCLSTYRVVHTKSPLRLSYILLGSISRGHRNRSTKCITNPCAAIKALRSEALKKDISFLYITQGGYKIDGKYT